MRKFKNFKFWDEKIWQDYFYCNKDKKAPKPFLEIKERIKNYQKQSLGTKLKVREQLEKDETYWTASTFIPIIRAKKKNKVLSEILQLVYGDIPPIDNFQSWDECLRDNTELILEKYIPSPQIYKDILKAEAKKRNIIPYIFQLTRKCGLFGKLGTSRYENASQVDAVISNMHLSIFIESKVLSDISCTTTHDVTRNQIARTIDIMLSPDTEYSPNSLFLLITPKIFQDNCSSRFYGYKMYNYREHPKTLKEDLRHRKDITNWDEISKRLGWITWEDIIRIGESNKVFSKKDLFISNFPEIIETCSGCNGQETNCKII